MRFTRLQRTIVGVLAVGLLLVAAAGLTLKRSIDHLGDRTDKALSSVSDLRVRVDGLDAVKVQVDDALAQVRVLAGSVTAGITVNVESLRSTIENLARTIEGVPALVAKSSESAAAQVAALLDTVHGLVTDLGRSLAPVGSLADRLGQPVRFDVHIVQPLLDDLLNLVPTLLAGLT